MQIDEYPILVEQLCPGLFIRIDEPGLSHPFPPKGFLVRTDAEVAKVLALGLSHVYCVPDKSDNLPISLEELDGMAGKRQKGPWATARTPVSAELSSLKRETIERNKDRLERFSACERRYEKAMDKVVEAIKRVSSPNAEVLEAASEVVGPMAEVFLSDLDVLINVMTAKMREESKHYHALNVAVLSMMLAKEMGLDKAEIEEVGTGSLFHDVGKGRVPIQRFSKGNMVTMSKVLKEYYMEHPKIGAKMLAAVPGFPPAAQMLVLQHHELLDGTGFPARSRGEAITIGARIAAVANVYDRFLNAKDGSALRTPHEAMKALYKRRGPLDPKAVTFFIRKLGVYPPGSLVELSNGMKGMVVSANMRDSLRPSVKVYHPDIPKREALIIDLTIETELTVVKALRQEDLASDVVQYLNPGKQVSYYVDAAPRA
ncbi:HD-GYP domain-containing protein [Solidesulfovibrio sp.]